MAFSNPTSKFIFNHVGLRVVDLERSVDFYRKAFGMTEISRISLETSTVVFLAYPGDNHPDPSSVFEREGVLELVASKRPTLTDNDCAASTSDIRRVKLAFSVPNIAEAIEHMGKFDVKVVKAIDQTSGSAEIAKFLGCEMPDKGFDVEFWKMTVPIPFVQDPDGNLIELLQQGAWTTGNIKTNLEKR